MIDGVKIYIENIDLNKVLENPLLSFIGSFDVSTGEVLKDPVIAKYKGLLIRLIPSTIGLDTHCLIEGSIHKFYNNGYLNNTDFFYWQLLESLNSLEKLFKSNLSYLRLQNIEFGVNINCQIPARKVIQSMISNGNRRFADMNIKDVLIGKVCTKPGADYELKVYDKGKQAKTGEKNLLRIEVKVKKMRFLEPYKITSLASLLSRDRIGLLGQVLAKMWANLVYYDGSINEKELRPNELLKLKDFQNPMFWESINRKKRYREREYFERLKQQYSPFNQQKEIENLILSKWENLVNWKRQKQGQFHQLPNKIEAAKTGTISQLEYRVKSSLSNNQIKGAVSGGKILIEKRYCLVCGADISNKKITSKYCSRKCRNKSNNQIRQRNRNIQVERERNQMKVLISELSDISRTITVISISKDETIIKNVRPKSIRNISYCDLRQIRAIKIKVKNQEFVFTKSRAKEAIKLMSEFNLSNHEKIY